MILHSSVMLLGGFFWLSALTTLGGCWGELGHRTIAYLAESYLSSGGAAFVDGLLGGADLSDAALWADEIRGSPRGRGTAPWHYIDAMDDPPRDCGVRYNRDCEPEEGCVVSAIVNMTSRINDADLSRSEQRDALRFLLHFIADIHQPLHTENESRGGNDISVRFEGDRTNLHAIWDTQIPVKHNGGPTRDVKRQATRWADKLFNGGSFAQREDTLSCVDITRPLDCALEWANEANGWICDYVLQNDVDAVRGKELSGEYYEGAVPIVDELVAKAGVRLAAWLNGLAAERAERGISSGEV